MSRAVELVFQAFHSARRNELGQRLSPYSMQRSSRRRYERRIRTWRTILAAVVDKSSPHGVLGSITNHFIEIEKLKSF